MNNLAKNIPFEEIAQKGIALYETVRSQYEIDHKGKFLAIEVDSQKKYLGDSTAEALEKARAENPEKLFYLVKIGFSSAETLANSFLAHA